MSRFADVGESVAEALRAGAAVEVAAEGAGVSASTVRGWLRRGKREPGSEFGAFVRSAEPSADTEAPMTVEEIERTLATVIRRKQSVAAMKLWLDLHPQDRARARMIRSPSSRRRSGECERGAGHVREVLLAAHAG